MTLNAAAQIGRPTVLIVEDDAVVAIDLSDTAEDLGLHVIGPFRQRAAAAEAIAHGMPDFAILDVITDDGEIFPLADALSAANVPMIFHSGKVMPEELCQRYPHAQAAAKPCPPGDIIAMLRAALLQAA